MDSSEETMLEKLFVPESIALIGASGDPAKLAGRPYRYLLDHGYEGELYLVNPKRDAIDGTHCYDSITDVPESVDLAMVLVPASLAPTVVEECGDAGVPYAIVIASGFSETDDGEALESTLATAAEEAGVRLIGPNSEGMVNVHDHIGASFSSILKRDQLIPGPVSFVTQSGAFGGALFQLTQDAGVGGSKWLSTGNEADLTTLDFLEYLVEDPDTDVVVTYIEALEGGERLLDIGRRSVETDTDIVAIKLGASPRGKQAAASHTGSIASADEIYDAVFRQSGIIRLWDVREFVDVVTTLARVPSSSYPELDDSAGTGVGVVSVSGGAAVLIADTADRVGLPMATFSKETVAEIQAEIPPYGSATNPVDVTGGVISDPAVFERCLRSVVEDDSVEGLILQFGNSGRETIETCKAELLDIQSSSDLPVAVVFTGGQPREDTKKTLQEAGILIFEDPVAAVRTLRVLADRGAFRANAGSLPDPSARSSRVPLPIDGGWAETTAVLSESGLTFSATEAVDSADGAVAAAERIGYPVAMKVNPLEVDHKADVGGVQTGLSSPDAVRLAYDTLDGFDTEILVQEMVDGVEVIVGVIDDPDLGPVMMVGPGGVFVELFDEFAYRALPVTEEMAHEMIAETPVGDLLDGYRDIPAGDVDALASLIVSVSNAYETVDVAELELNPVIVTPDDALAVDLLITETSETVTEGLIADSRDK